MNQPYPGQMAMGIGKDTYGVRPRLVRQMVPSARMIIPMPKPPPRFPTPGQMDGSRNYSPKGGMNMMLPPAMYGGM
jgi:hypothetical protein